MATKIEIPAELKLERETCGRCGGSGHYSYCQMYGTTCFKCAGRKEVLTKRGAAAMAHLKLLRSRPASDLKAGDIIRVGQITNSGTPYNAWAKIIEIRHYDNSRNRSFINGVEQPQRPDLLEIETTKVTMGGVAPESLVELLWSDFQGMEFLRQAKEFEQTLTKQGKPRKVKQ